MFYFLKKNLPLPFKKIKLANIEWQETLTEILGGANNGLIL